MTGAIEQIDIAIAKLNELADATGIRKALLIVEITQTLTGLESMLKEQKTEANQNGIDC